MFDRAKKLTVRGGVHLRKSLLFFPNVTLVLQDLTHLHLVKAAVCGRHKPEQFLTARLIHDCDRVLAGNQLLFMKLDHIVQTASREYHEQLELSCRDVNKSCDVPSYSSYLLKLHPSPLRPLIVICEKNRKQIWRKVNKIVG